MVWGFGSCLPNDDDGGVLGEIERVGLQRGGLGELLERAAVGVQAGGVAGLRRELGEQRAVAVCGLTGRGSFRLCLLLRGWGSGRLSRPGPGWPAGARR